MPFDSLLPSGATPHAIPYALRSERADDSGIIEALLDRAFGSDRHTKRSYAYRQGVAPVASLGFVATRPDDAVIGTLRFWPVLINDASRPALLLGPIAVEPELKGLGVGKALMRKGLFEAERQGHDLIVLVGDLSYYRMFGFTPATPLGLVMPHERPHRLLALELRAGSAREGGVLRPALAPPLTQDLAPAS